MNKKLNPSIRLHTILTNIITSEPGTTIEKSIKEKYNIKSTTDCIEFYLKIILLTKTCITSIEKLSDLHNQDLYSQSIKRILNVLIKLSHIHGTDQLKKQISNQDLNYLLIISDLLNGKNINELPLDDKVTDIKDEIQELIEKIKSSNLDNIVKMDLIRVLNNLKSSLDFYDIDGVDSFKSSIEMIYGHLGIHKEKYTELTSDNDNKDIFEKLIGVTSKINEFYTFANNTAPLIAQITMNLIS